MRNALGQSAPDKRPNVVLIMADDLGYECIGANGCTSYQTPNIDRMAVEGTRFTQCCSQPLCTPSRVQIMTGRYNCRNYTAFGALKPGEVTFAHMLKDAGYATCVAGKWQLAKSNFGDFPGQQPGEAGFDEHCLWQLNVRGSRYLDPLLEINGEIKSFERGYGPDVCTDFIVDFIERHKEEPFLVYYPMILTHVPVHDPPCSAEGFKGMVERTDKLVGRIAAKLEQLGLKENTLVMFTGDNGTHATIRTDTVRGKVKGGKGRMSRTGVHVPLIATWPCAMPTGHVSGEIIDFSDFLPTFADLTGARLPEDRVIDGVSFADHLRARAFNGREWSYCFENSKPHNPRGASEPDWFARTKEHKLYGDGKFCAVAPETLEETPLDTNSLTPAQRAARDMLQKVIDKFPNKLAALQEPGE
jgi:arylsulfatase A